MYRGERFNSISHLIGAVLSLVGFGALLAVAVQSGDLLLTIGFCVFGVTLILLYTMSTLYHSFSPPKVKRVFQKLDHVSIYLLIAGTYTPYMLVSLKNGSGLWILGLVWGLAALGVLLDLLITKRLEWLQLLIYLAMGWLCLAEYSALRDALQWQGVMWLTLGGLAYTLGVSFYLLDQFQRLTHAHGIWHLFVLAGSICHFISIIGYVRP